MKPFFDPTLRPIDQPLFDDATEPYLDEADIPKDCFEVEISVDKVDVQPDQNNLPDPSVTQPKSQHEQVAVDNQSIFSAEKILKRREKKGKYLVKWANYPENQST